MYKPVVRFRAVRKPPKRNSFRFEQLEGREMMSADPVYDFRPPARAPFGGAQLETATAASYNFAGGILGNPTQYDHEVESFAIPALSSNAGAPVSIFLDFDGNQQTSTAPFNRDDNPLQFSKAEQDAIHMIWSIVAEDYAPFNVNVTTIEPGDLGPASNTLRVAIGGSDFRSGRNAGGTASVNSFSDPSKQNIAFVFSVDKETGAVRDAAFLGNAASHESGHAFGLEHQSEWLVTPVGNFKLDEYLEGDGNRSPIMGDHESGIRATWATGRNSKGSLQDDMQMLARPANGFGFRADDHGETIGGASGMTAGSLRVADGVDENGAVNYKNVGVIQGSGIISNTTEKDTFRFYTGGGSVSLWLTGPQFSNLHARLRVLDFNGNIVGASGVPIESNDLLVSDYAAFENVNLDAGTYFVQVQSFGEYGDVGQYSVHVAENKGPQVVNSRFVEVGGNSGLIVTFNEDINPLTFTAKDVRIGAGAPGEGVLGVQRIAPRQFLITYVPSGAAPVAIGPDIRDMFGNAMDQNKNGVGNEASDYYLAEYYTPKFPGGALSPLAIDAALYEQEVIDVTTSAAKTRTPSRYNPDAPFDSF